MQAVVRAKFKVMSVTRRKEYDGTEVRDVKLYPVSSGSEENKSFFKYTPCGEIVLGTTNADAADKFELGKEYYVDFTPAEPSK